MIIHVHTYSISDQKLAVGMAWVAWHPVVVGSRFYLFWEGGGAMAINSRIMNLKSYGTVY